MEEWQVNPQIIIKNMGRNRVIEVGFYSSNFMEFNPIIKGASTYRNNQPCVELDLNAPFL